MLEEQRDRHAEERQRERRKTRYGMRVSGRSVRLLQQLSARPKRRPRKQHKKKP